MATATEATIKSPDVRPTQKPVYPKPHVGMWVLWRADRSSSATPALVMAIGRKGRLGLHVTHEEASNFDRRDGVPFIEDKNIRDDDMFESGCWDYTDDIRKLFA